MKIDNINKSTDNKFVTNLLSNKLVGLYICLFRSGSPKCPSNNTTTKITHGVGMKS